MLAKHFIMSHLLLKQALCMTLKFLHSNLGRPCLNAAPFVHRGIVMVEQVWTSSFR